MYGKYKDYEELKENIKNNLSNKRYLHSEGVVSVAIELAKLNEEDVEKAKVAAILHDCAKELTDFEINEFCKAEKIDISYLDGYKNVLHSHIGYFYAKVKFGIEDEDILNSIKYHTTARAKMSTLEKIIYLADFLDPNRDISNYKNEFETAKRYTYENLNKGMQYVLERTKLYLDGKKIYKDTIEAYEYYKDK